MLKKILILSTACVLLVACGGKKERVVETVEYIYANNETTQSPEEKYKDKKKLFEKDSYCYYLLKFDKDAIDGVVAKIAYVNTNPENKNLELKIAESNINGFLHLHGSKGRKISLRDNWDGTYNIEFEYSDFIDKIDYIQLKLEASVNGRKFALETLEDGSLSANNIETVKVGEATCVIIGDKAYSNEYIYITSETVSSGWSKSHTNNETILVDTDYIDNGITQVLWYPENKEIVLESINKKLDGYQNDEYAEKARKLLNEFMDKVAPRLSATEVKEG